MAVEQMSSTMMLLMAIKGSGKPRKRNMIMSAKKILITG